MEKASGVAPFFWMKDSGCRMQEDVLGGLAPGMGLTESGVGRIRLQAAIRHCGFLFSIRY